MTGRKLLAAIALTASFVAAPFAAQAQTPAELALRIDRLEAQIRELTGLIQQLTFQVEDLQQLVDILRADNEALYQLLAGADPNALGATPPLAGGAAAPPLNLGDTPVAGGGQAGGPLDLTEALRLGGNANVEPAAGNAPPLAVQPPAVVAETPINVAATGDAQADYNRAYQLLLNGDYTLAEEAFSVFLASYPGHVLSVDAEFWVAESLFSRGLYSDAANQFYSAFVANQGHTKAPDMLLKLGLSFVQLGQTESACDTFRLIPNRFPNASNALLQRAATEQTNAGC